MIFTTSVGDNGGATVEYDWVISAGTIISGQGTPMITVRTDKSIRGEITATVTLKGLPPRCKNSASQQGFVDCLGDPPLIDEYGVLKQRQETARLDQVLVELKSRPGWVIYVIEYNVSERANSARANRMTSYFGSKKITQEQLVFVYGGPHPSGQRTTKIYLVPPEDHCLTPKS
jgi:hypothetical protein